MLVSLAKHTVKLDGWETKRELTHALAACDSGSILLGEDLEVPHKFYSVIAYLEWPKHSTARFGIGMCSEGHGLVPHLLPLANTDSLLFGLNSEAVAINIKQKTEAFRILLDSLFACFVLLVQQKLILVFHEIGVVAIAEDGQELWRYDKDVIVDKRIGQGSLELQFMDSPAVTLETKTGKVMG